MPDATPHLAPDPLTAALDAVENDYVARFGETPQQTLDAALEDEGMTDNDWLLAAVKPRPHKPEPIEVGWVQRRVCRVCNLVIQRRGLLRRWRHVS